MVLSFSKALWMFTFSVFYGAVAMDNVLDTKCLSVQELPERDAKRHKPDEEGDTELLPLSEEQLTLVENSFEWSCDRYPLSFHPHRSQIVAKNFGRGNELIQSINKKVRAALRESEDSTIDYKSELIQRKMKARLKKVINEGIEDLFKQNLITPLQKFRLSVITLKDESIELGQRISFQNERDKDPLLQSLFEKLVLQLKKRYGPTNFSRAFVLGHPLFPTIVDDIQRQFGDDYTMPHKTLACAVMKVASQFKKMKAAFGTIRYRMVLNPLVFELLLTKVKSDEAIAIPRVLLGDGQFPYAYLSHFLSYDERNLWSLTPFIPSLLSTHSRLKEKLSVRNLAKIWGLLSSYESYCYWIMPEKKQVVLTESFNLLAKAILRKKGNLADCLARNLRYHGGVLSVKAAFNHGVPLTTDLICAAILEPFEYYTEDRRAPSSEDLSIIKELIQGLEKTMKAIVGYSFVYPEEPKLPDYRASRHRVIEALLVFKRFCATMPKGVRAMIFSRDPALAQDVLNVFLVTQKHYENPQSFFKELIHEKLLEYEVVIALLKRYKLNRLKEFLLKKNDRGETPFTCYRRWTGCWKAFFDEDLHDLDSVSLSLFDPEKLEENFGSDIEENIRSLLLPYDEEALEPIKL